MSEISKDVDKKGREIFDTGRVKKEMETDKRDYFVVQGDTEEHSVIHNKIKDEWVCTCKYWTLKQRVCSHILAAQLFMKKPKKNEK